MYDLSEVLAFYTAQGILSRFLELKIVAVSEIKAENMCGLVS